MMVNSRLDDGNTWFKPPAAGGSARALARWALPALLGALMWAAPAEAEAAERCNSKPAVCARLKTQKAQRAARATPPPRQEAVTVAAATPRCTTKPAVCARLAARGHRPAAPPVTLASNGSERCTTKPMVCARLRMRPTSAPVTFANTVTAPETVD